MREQEHEEYINPFREAETLWAYQPINADLNNRVDRLEKTVRDLDKQIQGLMRIIVVKKSDKVKKSGIKQKKP